MTDVTSSCSCSFDDIIGFTVGCGQSRFWMLRKHINQISTDFSARFPFFEWQCLTLFLPSREINLVIQKEHDFDQFLKLLIKELKTIDGERNSAGKILQILYKQNGVVGMQMA